MTLSQGSIETNSCEFGSFSRETTRACLIGAITTLPVKLHSVVKDLKAVAFRDLVLKGLDGRVLKLKDLPASEADQVIVVFPLGNPFVTDLAVVETPFRGKAQARQELQGTIHCRVANLGIGLQDLGVDLAEIFMTFDTKKDVKDFLALSRVLPAPLGHHGTEVAFFHRKSNLKLIFIFILTEGRGFVNRAPSPFPLPLASSATKRYIKDARRASPWKPLREASEVKCDRSLMARATL